MVSSASAGSGNGPVAAGRGSEEFPPNLKLHEMLRRMLRIRLFDETAAILRPTSIPGTLHNSLGQEGEIVGACMALRDDDYMTGNHRSHGHPIGKGVDVAPLMAELFGRSTGICRGKGGSMHLAAFGAGSLGESGIVGAAIPTAVGAALSAQVRGTQQVCLSFFGDGAANCGPFHESLNLASVWRLPVIFVCENNGYAICTPQAHTTAIADIAGRAASYGMPGVIVDGQDALAVYREASAAVARARRGEGPTLIEAKTYRYCDHEEMDSAWPRYRPDAEVVLWRGRDPIDIFVAHLCEAGHLTEQQLTSIRMEVRAEIEAATDFAERSPPPQAAALFEDVFL